MRGKWNGFERKMNANAITCFSAIATQLFDPSGGNRAPRALIDYTLGEQCMAETWNLELLGRGRVAGAGSQNWTERFAGTLQLVSDGLTRVAVNC